MAGDMRILALFGGTVRLGSERANLEALTALREGGATVRLVMSDAPWAEDLRQDILAKGFEMVQCSYLLLPRPERRFNPLFAYPVIIARASGILLREMWRFKPTHFYTSAQLFVLNFLPVLVLSSTPLIYRCGDQPILHNGLFRGLWWFISRRSQKVVAVSKFIADRLVDAGLARDRILVIYTRPPSRRVEVAAPVRRLDEFRFVFIGQINEAKGANLLVEAFSQVLDAHPDARLVIAGRISEWEGDEWARNLRDKVHADPRLADRVTFPGFVEDVASLLSTCQVAVTPTISEEPLANVVIEAKAAGLASIIFRSGGLPEIVAHGIDGHICPERSVEALRDALLWYLEHREEAGFQGEAARRSLQELGVDHFVDSWMSVFDRSL